jgi:hypothetical protein
MLQTEVTMSDLQKLTAFALTALVLAGCASANPMNADSVACVLTNETSPPSATPPTGPTAMNPPAGYPPLMNPTAPITVAATPSNMGYGGARTASTVAVNPTDDCNRRPRPVEG